MRAKLIKTLEDSKINLSHFLAFTYLPEFFHLANRSDYKRKLY
jgi:hypothetical protein